MRMHTSVELQCKAHLCEQVAAVDREAILGVRISHWPSIGQNSRAYNTQTTLDASFDRLEGDGITVCHAKFVLRRRRDGAVVFLQDVPCLIVQCGTIVEHIAVGEHPIGTQKPAVAVCLNTRCYRDGQKDRSSSLGMRAHPERRAR